MTSLIFDENVFVFMFIYFHIKNSKGEETPQLIHISKAAGLASDLEKRGIKFRLGYYQKLPLSEQVS